MFLCITKKPSCKFSKNKVAICFVFQQGDFIRSILFYWYNITQIMLYRVRGSIMDDEKFLYHLLISISWQKQNTLSQKGKSDIEPPDYVERIEKWYDQITDLVLNNPPQYYVDSLVVKEDDMENAVSISYQYFDQSINDIKKIGNSGITFCGP